MLLDLFLLLATLLALRLWWRRCPSPAHDLPPGPPGWPIVGNLFQVILERRPFIYIVRDLRKQYGPIFTMQMGQRTLVIVTSADLIHEALVKQGPTFASRPADSPTRLVFSVGKCAINSAPYGPLWRSLRRNFVTEIINPVRIKQCTWIRDWAWDCHVRRLEYEALSEGFVEVMSNCRLTICSILVCLCFGVHVSEERVKFIEEMLKEIMMITLPQLPDFLPSLEPLFPKKMREAKKLRKKQLECLTPLIRNRRSFVEGTAKAPEAFVSPVGAAYVDSLFTLNPEPRGKLGDEEIATLCSEIISAGTDTSATTIEWALLHLVMDQSIQNNVYEEIKREVREGKIVDEDDVARMPYLNAVVKETFRRHPPSHFMLSHAATEDTELGGYKVPRGASVEFYTAWLTEDPAMWDEPSEFRPERFLSGDGADVDITGTKGLKMMPFGAGRRICPAWTLGVLHVNLLLARMVQRFKWLPHEASPPDPQETFAFTVVMKNPLKAVAVRR